MDLPTESYIRAAKSWRRMSDSLIMAARTVWIQMASAWHLGVMSRHAYEHMLKLENGNFLEKTNIAKAALKAKSRAKPSAKPKPKSSTINLPPPKSHATSSTAVIETDCKHVTVVRYGNAWGSFARCSECNIKWKWDAAEEEWRSAGYYSKPSQQRQSPWTPVAGTGGRILTLEDHNKRIFTTDQQYPVTPAMATRLATSKASPSTRQPRRRSRAPSMTSSAAGHGLTEEALQEFDELMEAELPLDDGFNLVDGNSLLGDF